MGGGDGGAGAEATTKKALGATASKRDDDASVPPVEQQQQKKQKPAPLPAAAAVADDGSAAAVRQCCGEEEQDDEQVERFYALLANIRALRGLYSAGTGPAAAAGRGSRKRAREAEPPWTPAFRLEDFEVEVEEVNQGGAGAADARCAVMNEGASAGVARRPAAAARARADDGHVHDGGVAEAARGGNKLGRRRRVAARG